MKFRSGIPSLVHVTTRHTKKWAEEKGEILPINRENREV